MKKLLYLLLFIPFGMFGQTQTVNVGVTANDHSGDPLRTAFQKVNTNFSAVRDSFGNIYREVQSRKLVNDSLNAVRAAAQSIGNIAWMKTDTAYTHKNVISFDQLMNYVGGGAIGMYELKGIVDTTTGMPAAGDSLIINTGFIAHPHVLVYRAGVLQYFNSGRSVNVPKRANAYVFNQATGTITVKPVFATGEKVIVHAFDPIVWNSLTPEGGSGGGGGGGASPLLDSLVAVWKLDNMGGTLVTESVSGYNGQAYGATLGDAGKIGLGATFTATNSIIVPYNVALSPTGDRMSISLWYKPSALASVTGHALNLWTSYDATSHVTQNISVDNANDYIYCDFMNTTGTEYLAHNVTPIVAGSWYHIVAVCDGATRPVKVYVNDVAFAGNTFSGTLHTTDDVTVIGNQNQGYSQNALGVIDDVVLSRQRFTKEDVALLWAGGVGNTWPW
jgi:hypothetical protein